MIRRHVELTQRLAAEVAADERFEIVAPHPLNLLCLRLVAGDEATDDPDRAGQRHRRGAVHAHRARRRQSPCASRSARRATEWRHVDAAWQLLRRLAEARCR